MFPATPALVAAGGTVEKGSDLADEVSNPFGRTGETRLVVGSVAGLLVGLLLVQNLLQPPSDGVGLLKLALHDVLLLLVEVAHAGDLENGQE